jgi:putative CocE/NonD family hydrolase
MRLLKVLLIACAALSAAENFDSVATSTAMVPMRDGVKLSTDIYLPARGEKAADGRFPVLVYRTPYNKAGNRTAANFFARHGYAVLSQDVRGRFDSEGEFYAFVNEGPDGYDTIEWAAGQKWSNGKVGTIGASYLAWDQYFAAMYRPPHLIAMFANVGGATFFDEFGYPGGTPNLGWPIWILKSAETSPQAAQDAAAKEPLTKLLNDPAPWLAQPPQKRAELFNKFPAHRKMYEDFYAHPVFDSYWKQKGFYTAGSYQEMKDVPTFFISGWFDYFAEGVLKNFTALSRSQKTMKKLWMGPWPHGIGASSCGDASFGPDAAVKENEIALDWFDHWMKGQEFQRIGPEPVRIFRMGGGDGTRNAAHKINHDGEWITAPAWPPAGTTTLKYYLRAGGVLTPEQPGNETPTTFVFDPANPVPTIGGRFGIGSWTPNCAQDQICDPKILGCTNSAPLKERPDVLSFSTPPLEVPLDVTGKVRATLWVSSDAPDTDFTAKIMDVYPDGYAMILEDGQIRASYRDGRDKRHPMTPGSVYEVTVDLGSVSNRFAAGHRIRVDLSSSNYPKFEPNPHKARNTIYHQPGRASHIELPVSAR